LGHQIKIGSLDSSPLPVPAHVTRLRVGSVNQADFFGWAQYGLLRMVGRTVPAGTVIDTESRTLDPRKLRSIEFGRSGSNRTGRYLGVPEPLDPGVVALVDQWAGTTPRGWAQVEAVVAGVRGHCIHDHLASNPEDCRDAVRHFLLRSRRGADYLFASATAVSLRLLGYQCRVIGGYYASPGRYDPKTRHTLVTGEDVHFWVEVLLPNGLWAAVEPTPGYELMGPVLSPVEIVIKVLGSAWSFVQSNAVRVVAALVVVVFSFEFRRLILDGLSTLWWWLSPRGRSRDRLIRTLRLVELRSIRAGLPRPPGSTPARWYRSISIYAPSPLRAELEQLIAMAGWASHAPERPERVSPWSDREIDTICSRAVRCWTLGRFRAHQHPPDPR
jgi:hypothetical protein